MPAASRSISGQSDVAEIIEPGRVPENDALELGAWEGPGVSCCWSPNTEMRGVLELSGRSSAMK